MDSKGKYGSLIGKEVKVIFVDSADSHNINTSNRIGILISYDESFINLQYPSNENKIEAIPIARIIRMISTGNKEENKNG